MRTKQGGHHVSFLAGSKKRKWPATTTNQGGRGPGSASKKTKPAPVGTPAMAEVRAAAAADQGPLPGSGKHGADLISQLPDTVLGEIVFLLPTKEGARTQVLAKQWRHIWRSQPLNLDCVGLATSIINQNRRGRPAKNSGLDRVVSGILTSHQAPVLRLCIPTGHGCPEPTVAAWLLSPAVENLQELEFNYVRNYGPEKVSSSSRRSPILPVSTFRFAATLRRASIGRCHLPDSTVEGLHFPQLKHLALQWVRISKCSIRRLIAGCPALEFLLIYCILGSHSLRINSLRLRTIGVRTYFPAKRSNETWLKKLKIENAPCLERFIRLDLFDGTEVSVISAPKVKILGFVNNKHSSYSRIIKGLRADSLTMEARLVKTLVIHLPVLDLNTSIDLIRSCPCLEKLCIQNEYEQKSGPKNFWRRKHQNLIGSLDIRLKTIVLETYRGSVSEVNFLQFFVLNARELELMTIQVETIDKEFIAKHERLLQIENKASIGARFHFTTDTCLQDISDTGHSLTEHFILRC